MDGVSGTWSHLEWSFGRKIFNMNVFITHVERIKQREGKRDENDISFKVFQQHEDIKFYRKSDCTLEH